MNTWIGLFIAGCLTVVVGYLVICTIAACLLGASTDAEQEAE